MVTRTGLTCRQAVQELLPHASLELDVTDTGRRLAQGWREVVPLWAKGSKPDRGSSHGSLPARTCLGSSETREALEAPPMACRGSSPALFFFFAFVKLE